MNKTELIRAMANSSELGNQKCETALEAFMEVVGEQLATGETVNIMGFGVFEAKHRAARTGRNPKTGEVISIPATVTPVFKAGKGLKDAIKSK